MSFFEQTQSRRDFLRSCSRNFSFAAVGLVGGTLFLRKQLRGSRHDCINEGICDGCSLFKGCILPQALSARESMALQKQNQAPVQ